MKSRSGPFSGFDLQPSIKAISKFGRRAYWREMVNLYKPLSLISKEVSNELHHSG